MSQPPPYGQPPGQPNPYGQPPTQSYGQRPAPGYGPVPHVPPAQAPVPYQQPAFPARHGFQHPQHAPRHTSSPFYKGCGALGMGVFGLGALSNLLALFAGTGGAMGLVTTMVFFLGFLAIFRAGQPKQLEAPKLKPEEIERNLLHMAAASNGRLTVAQVTMNSPLSSDEAKQNLDRLVENGMANIDVDSNGHLSYTFPDFAPRGGDSVRRELDDFDRRLADAQSAAASGAEAPLETHVAAEAEVSSTSR